MFEEARRGRPNGSSDVIPFWVYAVEGGARIERHVPSFPSSRELGQMRTLSRCSLYRMVFGQPRQDDLLRYLMTSLEPERLAHLLDGAKINLSPA